MESKVIFLDANIILDIIGTNRPKHNEAKELWKIVVFKNIEILLSEDILTNIFYISKEKRKVLEFFKLIQHRWKIVPFGKDVIKMAIDLSLEKDLDLEDVLQCLCANENGCDVFITNDKKFYDCGIKITNCTEFLNKI